MSRFDRYAVDWAEREEPMAEMVTAQCLLNPTESMDRNWLVGRCVLGPEGRLSVCRWCQPPGMDSMQRSRPSGPTQ